MMERTKRCVECKEWASEKHNRGFFRINNKVYCGVSCFYERKSLGQKLIDGLKEAIAYEKGEKDLKVQDSPQTNKGHKRQKQILKKGSKQKTRKNR